MAAGGEEGADGSASPSLPYSVSGVDAESARALFREGATLLLLNVPAGTLVGLDGQVFTVGPNFMGVKMIPPGVHLLTTQAVQAASRHHDDDNRQQPQQQQQQHAAAAAPPLAAFLDLPPRSVLVRGWDARVEALAPLLDADDEARFAAGARRGDFDRGLAPYDLGGVGAGAAPPPAAASALTRWRALAGLVTPALARRLMPPAALLPDGRAWETPISVTAEAAAAAPGGASAAERRLEAQLAEGRRRQQQEQEQNEAPCAGALVVSPATTAAAAAAAAAAPKSSSSIARVALAAPRPGSDSPSRARYTPVERLSKPAGLNPAQLTEANLDRSTAAEALLRAAAARGEEQGSGRGDDEAAAGAAGAARLPLAPLLRLGGPLLLGELQFAFAAFAAGGQSLEGFHQWRSIACLLLACERLPFGRQEEEEGGARGDDAAAASAASAAFFAAFLRVLAAQMRYALGVGSPAQQGGMAPAPPMVDDELLRESCFLRRGARRFVSALRAAERRRQGGGGGGPPLLGEVRAAAELLAAMLREGLGWGEEGMDDGGAGGGGGGGGAGGGGGGNDDDEEEDDDDDEGPTVVDLDEGYAL